jgi:hypothetical protein
MTRKISYKYTNDEVYHLQSVTRSSGKNQFAYIPYISHLFEAHEPNLMGINIFGFTLTSVNSI